MKELIMTIGLPYSGKTTTVKELAQQGYEVLERDVLLPDVIASSKFTEAVTREGRGLEGQELFEVKNRVAIELLSERVRELVRQCKGEKIVYDGTNLQRASRAGILALRQEGVKVKALVFDVPLQEIVRRAKAAARSGERKGTFNEAAIGSLAQMMRLMEDPSQEEGFSEIIVSRWEPEHQEAQESRRLH